MRCKEICSFGEQCMHEAAVFGLCMQHYVRRLKFDIDPFA